MKRCRQIVAHLLPLLLVCALVSCGTPTTPSSSMTLKLGQVNNSIAFFPLYVARTQGFFKTQGLTLDPTPPPLLGSGAKLSTAVETGSIGVGIGATTDAFTASRIDADIRMLAALSNAFLIDITVSKQFEAQTHLNAKSPLAEKVKALVGKKIGISASGSASDALITYLFRQYGLDAQRDVTTVNLGANAASEVAALAAGRVDAISLGAPGGEEAEAKGVGDMFISPVRGDVREMQGQLFGVLYTKQPVIDAKPRAIQALLRGIAQAERFISEHPAEAMQLLGTFLQLDPSTTQRAWNATKASIPLSPQISQQAYTVADTFHLKAGLIAVPLACPDLVDVEMIQHTLGGPASCI